MFPQRQPQGAPQQQQLAQLRRGKKLYADQRNPMREQLTSKEIGMAT
jgi:hypothetical protein